MELQGIIKFIDEVKIYGNNGFQKRELVITTQEQYPQTILIEFTQAKCSLLDNFQIADEVKIDINIKGREWINQQGETRYFNSVQGWRIEKVSANISSSYETPPPVTPVKESDITTSEEEADDLPF